MAKEKAPTFQFYPRDFMGDLNVQAMDWDERGVYFWLLCLCWCEETIPADPAELANICRIPRKKFTRIWDRVGRCFTTDEQGMLRHARLDAQRKHYEEFIDRCSEAGKLSAQMRAKRRNVGSTNFQPGFNEVSADVGTRVPPQANAASADVPQPLLEAFDRWIAEYPNAVRVDTGKDFAVMTIKRDALDRNPITLDASSRKVMAEVIKTDFTKPRASGETEGTLSGTLRAAHLDEDWLEVSIDGDHKRIFGVGETVDDEIGPLMNRAVVVKILTQASGRMMFVDIEAG